MYTYRHIQELPICRRITGLQELLFYWLSSLLVAIIIPEHVFDGVAMTMKYSLTVFEL